MKDWSRAQDLAAKLRTEELGQATKARLTALALFWRGAKTHSTDGLSAALVKLGPEATGVLLIAAGARQRRLRRAAVSALVEIGGEEALSMLIATLEDDDARVRERAAAAITRIGEPAVGALRHIAASDQVGLRRYAVRCLADIASPGARTVLLQALDDSDKRVRRHALRGLARAGTAADAERLERAAGDERGENARIAKESLQALSTPPPAPPGRT
jgi:hypothetical protein